MPIRDILSASVPVLCLPVAFVVRHGSCSMMAGLARTLQMDGLARCSDLDISLDACKPWGALIRSGIEVTKSVEQDVVLVGDKNLDVPRSPVHRLHLLGDIIGIYNCALVSGQLAFRPLDGGPFPGRTD